MRTPILQIFSSVLLTIIMVGCADDLRDRSLFGDYAGEAMIRFDVRNLSVTRADDEADLESMIDHAYLLFYPADQVSDVSVPLAAVKAEVSQGNTGALAFKMPLRLLPETDYRMIAIANADHYVPEGFTSYSDYLEAWCQKSQDPRERLHLHQTGRISIEENLLLPMVGETVDGAPFRFSLQNGSYRVSASLSFQRTVARIDVANLVKDGLEVEGVALCNWRDGVAVTDAVSMLGNRFGNIQGILSDDSFSVDDSFIEMPAADENGIQQLVRSLYCFPSVTYDSYASDKESTAIIIKAKYGDDTESSFYRVNVATTGSKSEVKANTKYLVAIQSVKGRGASTPREAYEAEEPALVLSVVKDWDLDGSFAIDEKGNFILLSTGSLEFEAESSESQVVKVLTSGVLEWKATYVPDNDVSTDAFSMSRLSDNSMAIGPVGPNEVEERLSGRFVVSATTEAGGVLSVDVVVAQKPGEDIFVPPTVPDNIDFTIVPQSKRVKIDYEKKTIEIDAFDPDCFNSFIDVPFTVFSRSSNEKEVIKIDFEELQWPLEGCISKEKHADYCYISNSFEYTYNVTPNNRKVYSKVDGKEYSASQLGISNKICTAKKNETIYMSVGAMGPDDPAIIRNIELYNGSTWETYVLTIKPCEAIIDDVVLKDGSNSWLIMDRNMQDVDNRKFEEYIGRSSDGHKYQAYNYTSTDVEIKIPFKYKEDDYSMPPVKINITESFHSLYQGNPIIFNKRTELLSGSETLESSMVYTWLRRYRYESAQSRTSPFYEQDNYLNWILPSKEIITLIAKKMKVSKMRMYLLSDIPAKEGKKSIPICCYLPYRGLNMDEGSSIPFNYGYFTAENLDPDNMGFIYCDKYEVKIAFPTSGISNTNGFVRLVRPLSADELNTYKSDYLGYGSPHRLTLCHPDTYESDGWLGY